MDIPIQSSTEIRGERVHLYQVVEEKSGYEDTFIIVDIDDDGIQLVDPEFEFPPFHVSEADWSEYEARTTEDGSPEWGY